MSFQDDGQIASIKALVNHTAGKNLVLKLFVNSITPNRKHTAASFREAKGGGYAPIPLEGKRWEFGDVEATYPEQVWTFAGELGDIHGFFIVQDGSDACVLAERFADGPYSVKRQGDRIKVTPRILMPVK